MILFIGAMKSCGKFSVGFAYSMLASRHVDGTLDGKVGRLRILPCPECIRFFLWLVFLDKLKANQVWMRKIMPSIDLCDLCVG